MTWPKCVLVSDLGEGRCVVETEQVLRSHEVHHMRLRRVAVAAPWH